jgi:hypothetical protein
MTQQQIKIFRLTTFNDCVWFRRIDNGIAGLSIAFKNGREMLPASASVGDEYVMVVEATNQRGALWKIQALAELGLCDNQ